MAASARRSFSVYGTITLLAVLAISVLGCDGKTPPVSQGGAEKPRVLIVHSYDNGFRWSAQQNDGIIEGLSQGGFKDGEYDLRVFYMDARINFTTTEQIQLRAEIAFRTIDEFKPELVFLTDDTAVEEVAIPFLRRYPDSNVSFVFSGVNGDPSRYSPVRSLEEPGVKLTGTVERVPFAEGFDAARRIFGPAHRVVIFADDSASSRTVLDGLRRSLSVDGVTYPLQVVDFIQIETFEEWKQKVEEYEGRADLIGVLNYHRVREQTGNIAVPRDVARWTVENSRIPVFGLISDWSADGLVMSFGNSGFETGVYVGRRGAEILNGANAAEMPIVNPRQYEMTFNLATMDKENIYIPTEELEKASETFR